MARRKNPNPSTRYRFSIPSQDRVVADWIAKQSNLSSSIHVMIRAFVRQFGFADAMCVEFGTTRRPVGRPPKGFQDMFDSMDVGPVEGMEPPDVRPDTAGGTGAAWSTPDVKPKTATKPAKAEPPVQVPKATEPKPAERPEPVDGPDDGMELPGSGPEEAPEDYRSQLAGIFGGGTRHQEAVPLEMPD